jgi:hypothetical protein
MRLCFGEFGIAVRRCRRTMRAVIFVGQSLLFLYTTTALSASQCDPTSIVVASRLRLTRVSHNSMDHAANDEDCRAYFKQFVEAVTARQTAASCQDGLERQRALEILDAEIEAFNDRIAAQSCGQ